MARLSKGRQERATKQNLKTVIGTPDQKAVMQRAMNFRREKFEEFIKAEPVFQNMNPMQQCAVLAFRHDIVDEKDRLSQVDGYEKGMIDCMTAVCNVLAHDYWPKSANKRLKKFVEDVCSLMDSKLMEAVTWEEMADDIYRLSGTRFHCDWFGRDNRPTPKSLFKQWRRK